MALCQCGCGKDAGVYTYTRLVNGVVYYAKEHGKPRKYIRGHSGHKKIKVRIGQLLGGRRIVSVKTKGPTSVKLRCFCGKVSSWLIPSAAKRTKTCKKCYGLSRRLIIAVGDCFGSRKVLKIKMRPLKHRPEHKAQWLLMECKCGTENWVMAAFAKAGKANACKKCGTKDCHKKRRIKIHVGDKFGNREVIALKRVQSGSHIKRGKQHFVYKLKCQMRCLCGDKSWADGSSLVHGKALLCAFCNMTKQCALRRTPDLSEQELKEILYNSAVLRYLEPNRRPCGQFIKEK